MKSNSGEIVIGLMVGLVIGGIILLINTGNEAQEIANRTGVSTSSVEVMADKPGESILTVVAPAVAGAGVGWVIDELSGKNDKGGNSRDNNVSVSGEDNNVNIVISGDSDNDTDTSNDGDDGSYNDNSTEN